MRYTSAELISAALLDYVNIGATSAATDRPLRQRAERLLNALAGEVWAGAPWWFRQGGASVTVTGTSGVCPSDFDGRFGTQGGVFISGQTVYPPLQYISPARLYELRAVTSATATPQPQFYTLRDRDPSTFLPLLQVYPSVVGSVTLNLQNYVKNVADLIDKPTAPTTAVGAATGLTGVYSYVITYVTASGQTEAGVVSENVTVTNQKISLSAIPTSFMHAVTSRKIYRTTAGGSTYGLVTTLADNTTTTYTDSTADGSLGAAPPTVLTAVTGTEQFPDFFLDGLLLDGLKIDLATSQGDVRDRAWKTDWRNDLKKAWAEFQQGQQQTTVLPRYGMGAGLVGGASGRWRTF